VITADAGRRAPPLVLASASPRRLDLLRQLGVAVATVDPPDIDETPARGEMPPAYVARIAAAKAAAVAPRHPGTVVLACDTAVVAGRRILPKAADAEEVSACLHLLAGRRHRVLSALTVIDAAGVARHRLATTIVTFGPLSAAVIRSYAESAEGEGKAGGYAIQGRAEAFVRFLAGSYSGVVGLPLFETRALLIAAGVL